MHVLEVGQAVFLLRFLPDGRRLIVGSMASDRAVGFDILSLPGGGRVPLNVPRADIDSWWYSAHYGSAIAADPTCEVCYIAWGGRLHAFQATNGKSLPAPRGVRAHQVVLSPDGKRLLAAYRTQSHRYLYAVESPVHGAMLLWRLPVPEEFSQVVGFLPDGERFVTAEDHVRIRSFMTCGVVAASRAKPVGTKLPQMSADGRTLGLVGYHSMYFWDLDTLAKPRRISGSSSFGDFRSFAFHPDGKTVAVIHGGPTLVKVYDLDTLKVVHKWSWKLGPLRSVAYSPDGTLGAAGSEDGRIVVWDVDG